VYDRELRGRTLTLGVSGKLYRNSLIMYDRETESLWSHLLGAAVRGPLKGARLRMIPSTFTEWGEWRRAHPDTLVLTPRTAPYDSYEGYYRSSTTGVLGRQRDDDRLPPKELVLGVMAPSAKAYAFRDLERLGRIRDRLAGRPIEVVFDRASRTAEAFLLEGRERRRLPATPIFWFAWVDFFPGAPLWEARFRPAPG
jgi:hypothetical protein